MFFVMLPKRSVRVDRALKYKALQGSNMTGSADRDYMCELEILPMTEDDLGEVMHIETRSFPDPWTPLAYAMELRHNHDAHYEVVRDTTGAIVGYIGWWNLPSISFITHVAVHPDLRRSGIGHVLVNRAISQIREAGASCVRLLVRASNDTGRAFYTKLGFVETGREKDYYSNPTEDGIAMEVLFESSDKDQHALEVTHER